MVKIDKKKKKYLSVISKKKFSIKYNNIKFFKIIVTSHI